MTTIKPNLCFALLILAAALLLIDYGALLHLWSNDGREEFSEDPPNRNILSTGYDTTRVARQLASGNGVPDSTRYAFLIKEYETAVREIQMRLDQESLLFSLKFSLVGAILALLLGTLVKNRKAQSTPGNHSLQLAWSPEAACLCWAAVITSAIVDTRIHYHADVIIMLGTWIRDYVEPVLLGSNITGWETYLSAKSTLFHSQLYPLLRLNTTVLTLMLFAGVAYIFSGRFWAREESHKAQFKDQFRAMRNLCRAGSVAAFMMFFLVNSHFHYTASLWICLGLVWMLAGIMFSFCLWRDLPSKEDDEPDQVA